MTHLEADDRQRLPHALPSVVLTAGLPELMNLDEDIDEVSTGGDSGGSRVEAIQQVEPTVATKDPQPVLKRLDPRRQRVGGHLQLQPGEVGNPSEQLFNDSRSNLDV